VFTYHVLAFGCSPGKVFVGLLLSVWKVPTSFFLHNQAQHDKSSYSSFPTLATSWVLVSWSQATSSGAAVG
jgi:hypothetical protein